MVLGAVLGQLSFVWWGWLVVALFIAVNVKSALRIPHGDWKDMLMATTILPTEFLMSIRGAWILASWGEVVREKLTKTKRDLWAAQYKAEGV